MDKTNLYKMIKPQQDHFTLLYGPKLTKGQQQDIEHGYQFADAYENMIPLMQRINAIEDGMGVIRRKYSPSQPRVPAGNSDGGRWTSGSGSGNSSSTDDDDSNEDDNDDDNNSDDNAGSNADNGYSMDNTYQDYYKIPDLGSDDFSGNGYYKIPDLGSDDKLVGNNNDAYLIPANATGTTFNFDKATDKLNQNADKMMQTHPFGNNLCGHFVAEAVRAGNPDIPDRSWPPNANEFGPWLEDNGFGEVGAWHNGSDEQLVNKVYPQGYIPQKNDVVVIQPYDGGNQSGHTAMYNGDQWVSDFKQRDIWGGKGYRSNTPSYIIYRYGARSVGL